MRPGKHTLIPLLLALAAPISHDALAKTPHRLVYSLDAQASGVTETIDNIVNLTVVSKDSNDLKAEYRAGFVQGRLQAKGILSARDNSWNLSYLTDSTHAFPRQPSPGRDELERAARLLKSNYSATIQYIKAPSTDLDVARRLKRLLFRMVGTYHGASIPQPAALDFSGA